MLLSIKTGGCPEDCAYCPQSAHYKTDVDAQPTSSSLDELTTAAHAGTRAGRDALLHGRGLARRAGRAGVRAGARHGARRARPRHGSLLHARHARRRNRPTRSPTPGSPRTTTTSTPRRSSTAASSRRAPTTSGSRRWRACGRPGSRSAAAASSAWARIGGSATACCGSSPSLDPHPESVPVNLLVRVDGTPLGDAGAGGSVRAGADDRNRAHPDAGVHRPAQRRPAVADRRSAGAVLPRRRQLGVPRRSAADDAESRRERTTSSCSIGSGMRLTVSASDRHGAGACGRIARSNARVRAPPRRLGAGRSAADAAPAVRHRSSSNDYLALAHHPRRGGCIRAAAIARRRAAAPGSRLLRGDREAFDACRAAVRAFQGHRAGAVFLVRLPGESRRADDADRAGRRRSSRTRSTTRA